MNTAERIYAASASDTENVSRQAHVLARRIEDDIAFGNLPTGDALGSLRELAERYFVGRSVAREAIGLLERRGLGRLRPGPSGGFILTKPQPETIGEELANYFRETGVTLRQLMDARGCGPYGSKASRRRAPERRCAGAVIYGKCNRQPAWLAVLSD